MTHEKCDERDQLLQDWLLSVDRYAGSLKVLATHIHALPIEAETRILENIDVTIVECERMRKHLLRHRYQHGC